MNHTFATDKKAVKIPLSKLKPHPADPFKPYAREKLDELAKSIAEYGLFEPILAKGEPDGGFTILAGKNRVNACRLNEETEIDAYVYDVDDDTALMMITDSNLKHRDRLLPSERGYAYRMQLEALKRQGKRSDLDNQTDDSNETSTFSRIEEKLNSHNRVAQHNAVNRNDIWRHIRLTYLIPPLLEHVDNGSLPLFAGIDLSFLDHPSQHLVYTQLIHNSPAELDLKKSAYIKQLFKKHGTFNEDSLSDLLFQSRGTTERVIPLINRKMLKSLATEIPLPEDDEELICMFVTFLRNTFKAHGTLDILRETREVFY
jgi:ParB family chromosome partitioning protein